MHVKPASLNYHHLRYFREVARAGSVTRAARALRVSQSALSHQIGLLEEQLGEPLFARVGRGLELTETGRVALRFADEIFDAGEAMLAAIGSRRRARDPLRVGAVGTLSKNLQESFVSPLLAEPDARLVLVSASEDELFDRVASLDLDLALGTRPAPSGRGLRSRIVARQPVSLVGHPRVEPFRFPDDLARVRLLLPTAESGVRLAFDALCAAHGASPRVLAEVADMALLRLLARDTDAVALLPTVVVRDEIASGVLEVLCVLPGLDEAFYATVAERAYPHPLLAALLDRPVGAWLDAPTGSSAPPESR